MLDAKYALSSLTLGFCPDSLRPIRSSPEKHELESADKTWNCGWADNYLNCLSFKIENQMLLLGGRAIILLAQNINFADVLPSKNHPTSLLMIKLASKSQPL